MRRVFFIFLSYWVIACSGFSQLAGKLYVGADVNKTTGFINAPDSVFKLVPPQTRVLIEYRNDKPLMIDTLFMVIKSVTGATLKYYMKKGRNGRSVYGKIFFKKEGIYRVAIFNPKQLSRPITSMRLYITSPAHPTIASLIERQKKILVERGKLKENATAKNTQNKPTTPATNPTTQNKPTTPATQNQTATTAKPNPTTPATNKPVTKPTTVAEDDDDLDEDDDDAKNPADKDDDKNYTIDDDDVLDIDIDASDVDEASLQTDDEDDDDLDDL